ncbi:S-adenosyl-L-methionine-dependent methyltransferase [Talaromyces proteolyticus]|uniref:S-adenosyl-L-methionine-dependent methyltransferase n=1 Tax=Talaromyces proteolyticus TaxID=1131652 RepID=A0AAD4KJV0_9EURO|nr:S-adenosyl-L-methionine-dependent methyltransferase [Talaromyces proteolyticus]KAH8694050.1 S-adenosyl-L-methionine-dependent methyltransferase [Talaromyces proteolyticus]
MASAHNAAGHDHIDSDPGPLYQEPWIRKLLQQIQICLQMNSDWLGIDLSRPQRILDYACGNGTVSSVRSATTNPSHFRAIAVDTSKALLPAFPKATFQGIDIATSQVRRYNDEATKLLGEPHHRMFAIQGDLYDPQAVLNEARWSGFDASIISFALHHTKDPVDMLTRLRQRVRSGGTVVVLDFLRQSPDTAQHAEGKDQKYHAEDMVKLTQGMKIWPGFTMQDIHADMTSGGCVNVDVKVFPEPVEGPEELQGYGRIFIAKATVP